MKNCRLLVVLLWTLAGLASCIPRKRTRENIQEFHRTGIPIAADKLIREYEINHKKFHEEETKNGVILRWHDLDNKNLSEYCRKYLQYLMPARTTESTTGSKMIRTLQYTKENTSIGNNVFIVNCKVLLNKSRIVSYYITRAPEPTCVFALKCTGNRAEYSFNIIYKCCDFEDKPLIARRSLKKKKIDIISQMHRSTGEPIAKNKFLLEYEMEHREMVIKIGEEGKRIKWPYVEIQLNLNSYCYQYMKECVPTRDRKGVKGSIQYGTLHYKHLNTNRDIEVTIVSCSPENGLRRHYHMTNAPELNCVYALRRQGYNIKHPMAIIFKHCDFQDPNDIQPIC